MQENHKDSSLAIFFNERNMNVISYKTIIIDICFSCVRQFVSFRLFIVAKQIEKKLQFQFHF